MRNINAKLCWIQNVGSFENDILDLKIAPNLSINGLIHTKLPHKIPLSPNFLIKGLLHPKSKTMHSFGPKAPKLHIIMTLGF